MRLGLRQINDNSRNSGQILKNIITNDILLIRKVPTPKWMLPSYGYLALSKSRLPRLPTREALFFSLISLIEKVKQRQ